MGRNTTRLSPSDYLLLAMLWSGPAHGYELYKRLEEPAGVGMIWQVGQANLYAQLEKLARAGLIHGVTLPSNSSPARVAYALTTAGEALIRAWLVEPVHRPKDFRPLFLLKHHFSRALLGEANAADLRHDQRRECQLWLAELDPHPTSPLGAELAAFRRAMITAELAWLDGLEPNLSQEEKTDEAL